MQRLFSKISQRKRAQRKDSNENSSLRPQPHQKNPPSQIFSSEFWDSVPAFAGNYIKIVWR